MNMLKDKLMLGGMYDTVRISKPVYDEIDGDGCDCGLLGGSLKCVSKSLRSTPLFLPATELPSRSI